MAFENATYSTPNITTSTPLLDAVNYANEVTQFHNYGAFGIAILLMMWIIFFKLSYATTDKAHLVAFFLTTIGAIMMWTVGFVEIGLVYILTILTVISFLISMIE